MASEVSYAVHSGQQAPSLQEMRIACHCFVEQSGGLRQLFSGMERIRGVGEKRLSAQVKFVCEEIGCGCFLDRRLFARRDFGLKLRNYLSSDFAFDCKYIGDVAIVALRPELAISSRIDQLSAHAHAVTGTLHCSF